MEHTEQRQRHIFVVEDDPDVGAMVVEQLQAAGYSVQWETNGRAAIQVIESAEAPPDLIVLDLLLPDVSGEDVYAAADAHPDWRTVPVIVISALSTGAARANTLSRGVYIQKPFEPDHLLALVAEYCGQRERSTTSR